MVLKIEDALAEADKVLDDLAESYPRLLAATVDDMKERAAARNWAAVRLIAHDLKGQAPTLGWQTVGLIARSLDAALKTSDEDRYADACRIHIDGIQLCLARDLRAVGPALKSLLDGLDSLVESLKACSPTP